MGDVLMGYIVDNDESKSPRTVRVPEAKYWNLLNQIEASYTAANSSVVAKTAILAAVETNVGSKWKAETNAWIVDSIIETDLSQGAYNWLRKTVLPKVELGVTGELKARSATAFVQPSPAPKQKKRLKLTRQHIFAAVGIAASIAAIVLHSCT